MGVNNRYCVIVAGGVGSRIWPMSRKKQPKQFLDVLGVGRTLLRQTFERFMPMVDVENFIVVTNSRYRELVLKQLPELREEQVLCETIGRNTAPAIAYAAYRLHKANPSAQMIVTPADHFVNDDSAMCKAILDCAEFAQQRDSLVMLGIRPTYPETAYGYIQVSDNEAISPMKCFTEKPGIELAQTFLQCGEFLWNTGICMGGAERFIECFKKHLPDLDSLFCSISDQLLTANEQEAIDTVYSECSSVSIESGVIEREESIYVGVGDFGWSDVGTWNSVYQHSSKDSYGNTTSPNILIYDTQNTAIKIPENKVAVISGLQDFMVVDSDDVLIICPRSEEQSIKKFADEVRFVRDNNRER